MPQVVVSLVIFVGLGAFFLFIHLFIGQLVRPLQQAKDKRIGTEVDKFTIYECGEPTVGSAWVQFDLRYYVVALLFVIFDVEVAFFFPWATVFGKANTLALSSPTGTGDKNQDLELRKKLTQELGLTALPPTSAKEAEAFQNINEKGFDAETGKELGVTPSQLAWVSFADIMVFFGVLMVGFAYLWKRGDINWVRSVLGEQTPELEQEFPATTQRAEVEEKPEPVGASH